MSGVSLCCLPCCRLTPSRVWPKETNWSHYIQPVTDFPSILKSLKHTCLQVHLLHRFVQISRQTREDLQLAVSLKEIKCLPGGNIKISSSLLEFPQPGPRWCLACGPLPLGDGGVACQRHLQALLTSLADVQGHRERLTTRSAPASGLIRAAGVHPPCRQCSWAQAYCPTALGSFSSCLGAQGYQLCICPMRALRPVLCLSVPFSQLPASGLHLQAALFCIPLHSV